MKSKKKELKDIYFDIQSFYLENKDFEIVIPSGTQHGTTFRIPQQGLWDVNHPVRGDLMIEVILETPRNITADQLDKLKRMV